MVDVDRTALPLLYISYHGSYAFENVPGTSVTFNAPLLFIRRFRDYK